MVEQIPPLCLFCLDELKIDEACHNLVGCGCEVNCHSSCLQAWFQQKQQMECPICHVVRVVNPSYRIEPPREFVIVHVQGPPVQSQTQSHFRNLRSQEKCAAFCCLTIIFWWIGGLILEFAF